MSSRFDEQLPFYVNGTVERAEREWIDAYLRENPQARDEVDGCRRLEALVRADVPAVSSEIGLERTLARIVREGPPPRRAPGAAQPGLSERIGRWLASLLQQPVLKPAFAAALAVVVVQAGVIVHLAGEGDETSPIRALPGGVAAETGPWLRLNFKPDAREAEIRLLLVQAQASLAAGPGQLGDYLVRVPAGRVEAIAEQLRASAIVESVAIVDALPPRE